MDAETHMINVNDAMLESDEEEGIDGDGGELLGQDRYPIEYPPVDPKIIRAVSYCEQL